MRNHRFSASPRPRGMPPHPTTAFVVPLAPFNLATRPRNQRMRFRKCRSKSCLSVRCAFFVVSVVLTARPRQHIDRRVLPVVCVWSIHRNVLRGRGRPAYTHRSLSLSPLRWATLTTAPRGWQGALENNAPPLAGALQTSCNQQDHRESQIMPHFPVFCLWSCLESS